MPETVLSAINLLPHTHRLGEGASPRPGDRVGVHWAGYTKNYQSKRIGNTSKTDEPFEFVLGQGQASRTNLPACSCVRASACVRTCVCVCVFVSVCVHMCAHVCACVHA